MSEREITFLCPKCKKELKGPALALSIHYCRWCEACGQWWTDFECIKRVTIIEPDEWSEFASQISKKPRRKPKKKPS